MTTMTPNFGARAPHARRLSSGGLTYKSSGVDIDLADQLVEYIQERAPAIGGFSGLFPLRLPGASGWCLVASTDGVGTKLKLAFELDSHDTVGIDLVAMCVNDLITCGAQPLLFLDYYATGKLDLAVSRRVIDGILEGCRQGRMALLGGETAEMPGFYPKGEYDLAGFAVGIVRQADAIDGSKIFPGDLILGLPSSGVHSNGFSLVRKAFPRRALREWGRKLLVPTRIYVEDVSRLISGFRREGHIVLGLAHITGGGLLENVPRILPKRCKAVLRTSAWRVPAVFEEIRRRGRVPEAEMWRTFNMGLGLVAVIRPESLELARRLLPDARLVGEITQGKPCVELERGSK